MKTNSFQKKRMELIKEETEIMPSAIFDIESMRIRGLDLGEILIDSEGYLVQIGGYTQTKTEREAKKKRRYYLRIKRMGWNETKVLSLTNLSFQIECDLALWDIHCETRTIAEYLEHHESMAFTWIGVLSDSFNTAFAFKINEELLLAWLRINKKATT
jgi:hypothetical protein